MIGFDISRWQGTVNFDMMRNYPADFVIIKAGQGDWEDPRFEENWKGAKGKLPRASYWYYDNLYPPSEQAAKYWGIIKDDPEGVCWLDLEDSRAGAYSGWRDWYNFIIRFWSLSGDRRVGIYTGYYYWMEMMQYASIQQKQYFKQFPLWLASYVTDPFNPPHSAIRVPFPWDGDKRYLILQSGTPAIGLEAGVESKEIDFNIFMDDAQFSTYFTMTEPEESEVVMPKNKVTITYDDGARERQDPHAAGVYRNILPDNSIHYSDFDPVPDMDDPTNPDKKWIELESGWYIATRYPSSGGIVERARVEPVNSPAEQEITASFDLDVTANINGVEYAATVMVGPVRMAKKVG